MGLVAGFGGLEVKRLIGRFWGVFLGPLLILLGLVWPGWLRVPFLSSVFCRRETETRLTPSSLGGALGMGMVFSVAVCPFCTPALAVLLGMAATTASPVYGMALLLAFAIGRAVPISLGMGAIGWSERFQTLTRYRHAVEIMGGIILILTGLYMLNAYYFVIPSLAA